MDWVNKGQANEVVNAPSQAQTHRIFVNPNIYMQKSSDVKQRSPSSINDIPMIVEERSDDGNNSAAGVSGGV